jgi:chromosome segregation ATPase
MPDVNERLDKVEQRLTKLDERMDERFAQVDQRFAQVDQRFDTLEAEFQKLRMLEEQNATQIKQIAEVQAHHGGVLDEHGAALKRIEEALEPLKVLPAAIHTCFRDLGDHERRIAALEQASQGGTPET